MLQSIVLDEIHTYAGAQATEVAYLLRKLKNRLRRQHALQVFGTSASLPAGDDEEKSVLNFASDLVEEKVHCVLRGKRVPHSSLTSSHQASFSLNVAQWQSVGLILQRVESLGALAPQEWNKQVASERSTSRHSSAALQRFFIRCTSKMFRCKLRTPPPVGGVAPPHGCHL
jgi:ATP-dependent helicase YprA (DUF1998 family)